MTHEALVRFGRALREEGLAVGTDRIETFCAAAAALAPDDLYWAGRLTLVARPHELDDYDRVFREFFGGSPRAAERSSVRVQVDVPPQEDVGLASRAQLP